MRLSMLDWIPMGLLPLLSLLIGMLVSARSGASSESYFLSGRNVPWRLLGVSLVATDLEFHTLRYCATGRSSSCAVGMFASIASVA